MTQEALKLALEALESFVKDDLCPEHYMKTITVIKEALAQEQEPVAYSLNKQQRTNFELPPLNYADIEKPFLRKQINEA
jgi:hypothetical protein